MDKVSKQIRSEIMRKVRSTNNKSTEIKFKEVMIQSGLKGWKIHLKMKFSPDFVFENEKIAIFIDGCFWHGCPVCKKIPSSNKDYWLKKFERNTERDKKATQELTEEGWIVLRFWEHEIKKNIDNCLFILKEALKKCASLKKFDQK